MNQNEYARLSLELHLFFDRIMKEHSLFLEVAFTEKDSELKKIANDFQKIFSNILERIIPLANNNISNDFIEANEIVTIYTLEAETKTSDLSGISINTNITQNEMNLRSGETRLNEQLINKIRSINKQTLTVTQNLIEFKNDILNQVSSCGMYTTNYQLLITHIMNEAKMYHNLLTRVENGQPFSDNYLYEQELFWNTIMKEHAEFIRGLLDPSEKELILSANQFSNDYETIQKNYTDNSIYLKNLSLKKQLIFENLKLQVKKVF